jgi:hypothetical protein
MNKLLSKKYLIIPSLFFAAAFFLFFSNISFALEYVSSDYKVLDPSDEFGGGYSVSADYTLEGALGNVNTATSSATSYNLNPDFLYYPTITIPAVSPTAGDGQVSLSWTASVGELGWNVSGYNVGVSATSSGPYTFSSSLGNVLLSTRTGLSNGTLYYFVIRVEDAFGNIVATSSQVSATPVAGPTPPGGGNGGGGGGPAPVAIPLPVIPVIPPVLPATTTIPTKPVCKAYMTKSIKLGGANDPSEVRKLQTFLKDYEGATTLAVTGFYDQSSYNAVKKFQAKYSKDILIPWGDTVPTGYVFTQTLKKINEIYCQKTSEAVVETTFVSVTPTPISKIKPSIISIVANVASPANWLPALVKNLSEKTNIIVLTVADLIKIIISSSFSFFQQLFK